MFSPASTAAAAAPQQYFCHQCDRTVIITPSTSLELACPICNGGFLEEFELPEPAPAASADPFSFFFAQPSSSALSTIDLQQPAHLFSLLGFDAPSRSNQSGPPPGGTEPFNPFNFLQSYVQSLTADGANIQFVVEGGGPAFPGNPGAATFGDYFVGHGLEQLIQQLMDNDPNRYGTPPASKTSVEELPDVKITEEFLASDEAQCAVCKDTFEAGAQAKQMPCKHIYHAECIVPWLELHNSCPVCRYELPTDDPDYESQRGAPPPPPQPLQVATSGNDQGGAGIERGAGEPYSPGPRTLERRFRISLPWPWRTMSEEYNTGGAGGSDGAGNDAGNSEQTGNPGLGPNTRQEGLD